MLDTLGLPYMGSKRQIARPILQFIIKENPNCKYFYDLFGGGGAMSFEALQRSQIETVFYNELNTGVVLLLRDIIENGITPKYYNWINREVFFENVDGNTWLGGLCKVVWSFGNNQKDYMFGKTLEADKKLLHDVIVNYCKKSSDTFNEKFGTAIDARNVPMLFGKESINERRLRIMGVVKSGIKERFDLQRLERLERLEQLQRLQQLQQLEQLERLQRLQQLQQLVITNKSYSDVQIETPVSETVIYLDPPYAKTATYQHEIDHDTLYKYIEKSPYKIYLSSYESPLPCVFEIEHRQSLASKTTSKTVEKLFCNK